MFRKTASAFSLSSGGKVAGLLISKSDWPGSIRAFGDLRYKSINRLESVWTGDVANSSDLVVIAGTIGKSAFKVLTTTHRFSNSGG